MTSDRKVCIAVISGPHGIRGLVRLRTFTAEPRAVTDYGAITDRSGREVFDVQLLSAAKGQWLARITGIDDRTAAEALRGTQLFVDRDRLPPLVDEDEYYHADLIGMAVEDVDGRPLGTVRAIHDFGAGDLLDIARPGAGSVSLPFTRQVVPVVDLSGRRVVVCPPAGLMDDAAPAAAEHEAEAE